MDKSLRDLGILATIDTEFCEYSEKSPLLKSGGERNNVNVKERCSKGKGDNLKSKLEFVADASSVPFFGPLKNKTQLKLGKQPQTNIKDAGIGINYGRNSNAGLTTSTSSSSSASELDKIWKRKLGIKGNLFKYLGFICAVLSCLLQSFTGIIAIYLGNYHPLNVALWRYELVLIPSIPIVIHHFIWGGNSNSRKKSQYDFIGELQKPSKLKTSFFLFFRAFTSCTAVILQFYALQYIEVGDTAAIASTTPIFVGILSHWFLREKLGIVGIITAVITVIGVVVITRPPFLSVGFDSSHLIGVGLALGCMLLITVAFLSLRFLRHCPYAVNTFSYGLYSVVQCMVCALVLGVYTHPQNGSDWLLYIALGSTGFVGQSLLILAFKYEKAGPVSAVMTVQVIFTYLWQIIFLNQIPDIFSIVGAFTIVLALLIIGVRKWIEELPQEHSMKKRLWFVLK